MALSDNSTVAQPIQGVQELVELKQSPAQDATLGKNFQEFYQLAKAPEISRRFVLDRAEFMKFMKARTRQRTQFEAAPSVIDLGFDNFRTPFQFLATRTNFKMPSGAVYELHEVLDSPNGLTERVDVTCGDEKLTFPSYFQAEGYVLAKFLEEIKK